LGSRALSALAESLRRLAGRLGSGPTARRAVSVLRRAALAGCVEPVDVELFAENGEPGVWARLHPSDNLSEKRAFAGPQFFDWRERRILGSAIAAHSDDAPFIFVDAGANAGLYSLSAALSATRAGKALRIIAVEPEPEMLTRLRVNLSSAARLARIETCVAAVALSDAAGRLRLSRTTRNRGEVRVADTDDGVDVAAQTLAGVAGWAGLERIDALKIDIEGMEQRVLATFFAQARSALYPALIIIEAPRPPKRGPSQEWPDGAVFALLRSVGYRLVLRTRMNAVLERNDPSRIPTETMGD
jgi:FkbM family methyltransferase